MCVCVYVWSKVSFYRFGSYFRIFTVIEHARPWMTIFFIHCLTDRIFFLFKELLLFIIRIITVHMYLIQCPFCSNKRLHFFVSLCARESVCLCALKKWWFNFFSWIWNHHYLAVFFSRELLSLAWLHWAQTTLNSIQYISNVNHSTRKLLSSPIKYNKKYTHKATTTTKWLVAAAIRSDKA